jgi:uncharacterized protein YdaU (DUF1376 family)
MHYYQHHIGDFIKATARLSDTQTMGYLRLLWMYYDSEKPLKPDVKVLAFQIGSTVEDTELLLESFFILCENGWHHTRCDKEIADYRSFLDKKSNAGKASAERRKNKSSSDVEQVLNSSATDEQLTTNHKPITNNQKPIVEKSQRGSRLAKDMLFPSEWLIFCKQQRPDLQPLQTFEQFQDYWCAKPGKDGVKLDWFATWRNWVRNQKATKPNPADIVKLTVPPSNEPDPALEKIKADEKKTRPPTPEERAILNAYRRKA